jgi:hypothetical protein
MDPFNNEIDDNDIDNNEIYDDNYIDPEVFILIGKSLVVNFEKTKSEEDFLTIKEFLKREKEEKEKEENRIAIQILQQKIKEYEEKQKPKGFFSNLFTAKKDLFDENLEIEKYYYNKTLLYQLLNPLLGKVEQK